MRDPVASSPLKNGLAAEVQSPLEHLPLAWRQDEAQIALASTDASLGTIGVEAQTLPRRPEHHSPPGCPRTWIILIAGQRGDAPPAAALLAQERPGGMLADAGYDADYFRDSIARIGAVAVIPNNPSRATKHQFDRQL